MVDVDTIEPPARISLDPALLAFLKCHVTSFVRWDVLACLVGNAPRWVELTAIAREIQKPEPSVHLALAELVAEGLVEARPGSFDRVGYRLDPNEPTTRVVERLVQTATRSQELRRLIVARVVQGMRLAS
jgi:DNA-binding MarR family transcriptional regulator